MNPRVVLSLWRERWGKPSGAALQVPYVRGKVDRWGKRLAQASLWTRPAAALALAGCLPLLALLISVRFPLHDQLLVSGLLIGLALFLRRYAGMLVTLLLAGLALVATARYLAWRIGDTLPSGGLSLLLGLLLLAAEIYFALRVASGLLRTVWPLLRYPVAMPGERANWLAVDAALDCRGRAPDAVRSAALRMHALDWPKKKLKLHLLDDRYREELHAFAESIGARYVPDAHDGRLQQMLSATKGELLVLADCEFDGGAGFLQTVCAWFQRAPMLGLLLTPHHALAPAPLAQSLRLFDPSRFGGSCAVLRRAALAAAGPQDSVDWTDIAALLPTRGYELAHFGYAMVPAADAAPHAQLVRVDHPYSVAALRWKGRLAAWDDRLRSHQTLPRLLLATAPAACLLLGADLFRSTPQLLAAYALPHLIHGHFVQARLQGERRLAAFADLRETFLGCYLLVPTAFNLIRTRLRDIAARLRRRREREPLAPFDRTQAASYGALIALNLAALAAGLVQLPALAPGARAGVMLYLCWCAANLLLLAASLAVNQEARQIRQHVQRRAAMPAMLKLPLGRTIACATADFPALRLSLRLPADIAVERGAEVGISLFHDGREFAFPARVAHVGQGMLVADIGADAQPSYLSLAAAALSRGPSWPQWLAGPDADRLLPQWLGKGVLNLLIGILDFATNFGQHVRFSNRILFWKRRND